MYYCLVCECNVRVGDEPVHLHLLWVSGNVRVAHAMGDATVCMWQCFTHVSSRLSTGPKVSSLVRTRVDGCVVARGFRRSVRL